MAEPLPAALLGAVGGRRQIAWPLAVAAAIALVVVSATTGWVARGYGPASQPVVIAAAPPSISDI